MPIHRQIARRKSRPGAPTMWQMVGSMQQPTHASVHAKISYGNKRFVLFLLRGLRPAACDMALVSLRQPVNAVKLCFHRFAFAGSGSGRPYGKTTLGPSGFILGNGAESRICFPCAVDGIRFYGHACDWKFPAICWQQGINKLQSTDGQI